MSTITPIIIAALLGSVGALAGGILLVFWKKVPENAVHVLVSFAAGVLLGTAFFDLLPEALEHGEELIGDFNLFFWTAIGIVFFYLLDRAIHWFSYHQRLHKGMHGTVNIPLVIFGDSVHNFIDGVAIAITFLVNPALGVTTTLAVMAHELPQEIGDFAILLHEGMSKKKVLLINLFSALLAVLGAGITILVGEQIEKVLPFALSLTAGFFLYIALTNLLPEIHEENKKGYALWETGAFIFGIVAILLATTYISHG